MQARGKVINHGTGTRLGSRGQNLLDTSPHCSAKEKKDAGKGQQPQMPLMPGPPLSGAAMAPLAPMMNWGMQVPMPYQPMPYQPTTAPRSAVVSLPSGEPTQSSIIGPCHWPLPAMPKMPALPTATVQAVDLDLMAMLKQDVAELLLHNSEGCQRISTQRRSQTRSSCDKGFAKHRQEDYSTQFATQEKKLQDQVASTKEAFLQAKQVSAKAHDAAGEVYKRSPPTRSWERYQLPPRALPKRSRRRVGGICRRSWAQGASGWTQN